MKKYRGRVQRTSKIAMIVILIEIVICIVYSWNVIVISGCGDGDAVAIYMKAYMQSKGLTLYSEVTNFLPPLAYFPLNILLKFNNTFKTVQVLSLMQTILWTGLVAAIAYEITNKRAVVSCTVALLSVIVLRKCLLTFNYNVTCSIYVMMIMLLEVWETNKRYLKDILIALLVSLTILTKQSTGVAIYIISWLIVMFIDKDRWSVDIRGGVPVIVFCGVIIKWLVCRQFVDAMDQIFLGLIRFKDNAIIRVEISNIIVFSFEAILLIYSIVGVIRAIKAKDKNVKYVVLYGICFFAVTIYPIVCVRHISYSSVMLMITSLFAVRYKNKKVWLDKIVVWLVLIANIYIVYGLLRYDTDTLECTFDDRESKFYDIHTSNDIKNKVNDVKEEIYRLEQSGDIENIVLYSTITSIVTVDLDRYYYKYYDVPFRGNQGYRTLEEQAKDLLDWDNTVIILIDNSNKKNWQMSDEARAIIEDNCIEIANLGHHKVYRVS